jgi:ribonucleotide reductase alpha subunit
MSKDISLETIGTVGLPAAAGRDAVHIAMVPVVADEILMPNQDVGFVAGDYTAPATGRVSTKSIKYVGRVDNWLKAPVQPGETFWLMVYPRTITGLKHVWQHNDIPETGSPVPMTEDEAKIDASKKWIENFANNHRVFYDEIMEAAHGYLTYGEYLSQGGKFEGCSVPDEFWIHYAIVTGKPVDPMETGSFFSCSC